MVWLTNSHVAHAMQKDRQQPRSSAPKGTLSDSFRSPEKWCLRQEISSTPMFTNPLSRSGSSTSAETRWHIAPTVRHATRANVATVDLSERVTSHTTRSSKSDVNRAPGRANGTPSVTTPWTGQASRRRRILSRHRRPPRSRCLQDESTSRRSYRRNVVNEHTGQANTRRRRQTSMTTDPPPAGSSRSTPTTRSPGRSRTRFSKVVARTGGSRIGCCRSPTLRAIRATTPTPPTPRLATAHRSRTTVMAGEPLLARSLISARTRCATGPS